MPKRPLQRLELKQQKHRNLQVSTNQYCVNKQCALSCRVCALLSLCATNEVRFFVFFTNPIICSRRAQFICRNGCKRRPTTDKGGAGGIFCCDHRRITARQSIRGGTTLRSIMLVRLLCGRLTGVSKTIYSLSFVAGGPRRRRSHYVGRI